MQSLPAFRRLTLEQARTLEIKRLRERRRQAAELAAQGRGEDTEVAHVAPGEIVLPEALQTPEVLDVLRQAAEAHGIPLERLRVGHQRNNINPKTGIEEFDLRSMFLDRSNPGPSGLEWSDPRFRQPGYSMAPAPHAPTASRPKIIDDPSMMASFKGQAVASLPTNRHDQMRAYAQDIFPGEKYESVADRMSIRDGRVAYRDNDGATYYAEPSLRMPTSMKNMQANAKYAAGLAGPTIPYVGAAVGETIGGPFGAIGGAKYGTQLRQQLAQDLAGATPTPDQRRLGAGNAMIEQATGDAVKNTLKAMKLWPFKYFP